MSNPTSPEKNSASMPGRPNPLVISDTVDGSGPVVKLESDAGISEASITIIDQPGPNNPTPVAGSVIMRLADCDGQDLVIQKIEICLNGVPGSIYILCSNFVPDP